MAINLVAEEAVGGIGPEAQYLLVVVGLVQSRHNDFLLFLAQQAILAGMGIEREHRDARALDVEVALERVVEDAQLLEYGILGHGSRHLRQGHVYGDQGNAHLVVAQYHERLLAIAHAGLEILGVAREVKLGALDIVFVDRRRDQHIDFAVFQVAHCGLESQEGGTPGLLVGFAQLNLDVLVDHLDQVGHGLLDVVGSLGVVDLIGLHLDGLAVIGHDLARPVDDGRAQLEHILIGQGLEYHLIAYAIGIALRDTNAYFFLIVSH